jgi:hypothetical protein
MCHHNVACIWVALNVTQVAGFWSSDCPIATAAAQPQLPRQHGITIEGVAVFYPTHTCVVGPS